MKNKNLILIALIILAFSNCKENSDDSTIALTTKTWKRGLNDKNPSTNPSGNVIYYAVQNCEKDDAFTFGTDGKLTLNRGNDKCETNETQTENQTYTLNRTSKELVINGIRFTLAEESSGQIKYFAPLPNSTGLPENSKIIFLLQ